MVPKLRSRGPKRGGEPLFPPLPPKKKVGRPKTHRGRICAKCGAKLKTPQGLKKHLMRKLKCDAKSVAARRVQRKAAQRLASRSYYIRKKMGITVEEWRRTMPPSMLKPAN
ncbi:hypothetical protein BBJ28_00015531 [Nothophytophthora sp. Chile5]|nr:hypothetical protein BBJ28_00015531 [Nothophytophthora sp. Chile5]